MTSVLGANGILWLVAGVVLGGAYFFLMGRTVAAIGDVGGWRAAVLPLVMRIGLAAGVFALASVQGAAPLLITLIGFLIARTVTIARIKRGL